MASWLTNMYEASGHNTTFIEEHPYDEYFFTDDRGENLGYHMGELVKHLSPQTSLGTDSFGDSTEDDMATTVSFPNMLFNQYLISLGEFENLANYANRNDGPEKWLVHLLFIGATMVVQVILLNMMIAIMGDSYDYAQDNKLAFRTRG